MGASASVKADGKLLSLPSLDAFGPEDEGEAYNHAPVEAAFKDLNAALIEQMQKPLNAKDIETAEEGREQLQRIRFLLKCFVPLQCETVEEIQALTKDESSASAVVRNEAVVVPSGSFQRSDARDDVPEGLAAVNIEDEATEFAESLHKEEAKGERFTDGKFPPNRSSLAPDGITVDPEWEEFTWRRISEISPDHEKKLFFKGISPKDITQGGLGNCYFLSSLAVLAENPRRIERLFLEESLHLTPCGMYGLRLCLDGAWTNVVIDDFIPCGKDGKPAFAKPKSGSEFWVLLIEKAWSKVNGSYKAIVSGDPGQMLRNLTGAPSERFDTENDRASLWKKLMQAQERGFVAAASIENHPKDDYHINIGLIESHTYAILGVYDIGIDRLIRIRNPWGSFEWNGRWSDASKEWTDELKEKLGWTSEDDGIFFMSFKDFCATFDIVHINYTNDSWNYSSSTKCKFMPQDKTNISTSFLDPSRKSVLKLTCTKAGKATIAVTQKDRRADHSKDVDPYVAVRHWLVSVKSLKKIAASDFVIARDVVCNDVELIEGEYWLFVNASGLAEDEVYNRFVASAYGDADCDITVIHDKPEETEEWRNVSKFLMRSYRRNTKELGQRFSYAEYGAPSIALYSWSLQIDGVVCLLYENTATEGTKQHLLTETIEPHLDNMQVSCFSNGNAMLVDEGKIQITLAPAQAVMIVFEQIVPAKGFAYSYSRHLSLQELS